MFKKNEAFKDKSRKRRVVIIQGYNTPYRNELFNLISDYEDIELTLLYVSEKGEDRKWKDIMSTRFKEVQVKCKIFQINYVQTKTKLNYLDFIIKILRINPDVIISQLGKYTILINYTLFWKKCLLIHWSEATLVTEKNNNCFKNKYLRWHLDLPKAYLFPGILAKEYHDYCGFELRNRVFYAPNSIDTIFTITEKELAEKYANIQPIKFLFVGSFTEQKGFHVLIAVFNRLVKSNYNIELHVAGDGPIKPTENMINHGFLAKEAALNLYKSCHVFIMPSLRDCNPLSLIEAAKTGNVLMASKGVGNYPELIDGNGCVFEIDNEDDLFAQCMKIVSARKDALLKMAEKSIELASDITHENTAKSFYNAIEYVTNKTS